MRSLAHRLCPLAAFESTLVGKEPSMKPRILRRALHLLTVLGLATLTMTGARADIGNDARERIARFKKAQQQRLMSEPFAERREMTERIQALKKKYKKQ